MVRFRGRVPVLAREERGSVSVLSAGILVLACMLALVSGDLMRALQAKARAQTAADAAALAAAQEIALPTGHEPEAAAAEYAVDNGGSLASCQCEAGASEAVVEVDLPAHLIFLGPDRIVRARARAVIGPP